MHSVSLKFLVGILSFSDYYPFGMQMAGRNDPGDGYRYGFNGMEVDVEVSGDGNSYTTKFRQYDSRLGRWKSLDPEMAKYPGQSPYVAFNNNPILYIDPFGDDPPKYGTIVNKYTPIESSLSTDESTPAAAPVFYYRTIQYTDVSENLRDHYERVNSLNGGKGEIVAAGEKRSDENLYDNTHTVRNYFGPEPIQTTSGGLSANGTVKNSGESSQSYIDRVAQRVNFEVNAIRVNNGISSEDVITIEVGWTQQELDANAGLGNLGVSPTTNVENDAIAVMNRTMITSRTDKGPVTSTGSPKSSPDVIYFNTVPVAIVHTVDNEVYSN
jgi:RHS repeat-associated protein